MTTTVCDLVNKIITADTRWSAGSNGKLCLSDGRCYFLYCDETGFDKITLAGKAALITAGDGKLISAWKKWWSGEAKASDRPDTDIDGKNAVNIAILDLSSNKVLFDAGHKDVLFCSKTEEIKAFMSGSGGIHAASSLLDNGCAKGAIDYASELDVCTSNIVKYADYRNNDDNLDSSINDYSVIVDGIVNEGYIMELKTSRSKDTGYKISEHSLSSEISELFTAGKAVASAPVPGMSSFTWTDDVNDKFNVAMDRVHELRAEQ